jgi:hypothetical protein
VLTEATTTDVNSTVDKAGADPAAHANTTNERFRSEPQRQSATPGDSNSRVNISSKHFSSPGDWIAISKVTPAFVPSPIYELRTGPKKPFQPRNWLELEIEFSAQRPVRGDAVFRVGVLMNGTVFTGDIAVAPLNKGNDLLTVAYVSPSSLRRAFPGREPNYDSGLRIDIAVFSEGEMIGSTTWMTKSTAPVQQKLEQTIRPKSDTPFAPLYWDRYVEPAEAPSPETSVSTR